ncbi:MAG: DNA primase [Candidatus Algichlamydia australiensis]|nr:DNA primase [Chlamydiales bacterium]
MGIYSKESLDRLREKIDLQELLGSYLEMKRSGSTYKACCPFHEEKTPSFIVRQGDSHYHCFGCGAHGDAIAFLMGHLKLSFQEAVEQLAERYHVILEEVDGEQKKGPSTRELVEIVEKAADFYHFCLLHTDEGHKALHYLFSRGLDLNFVKLFRLGYAPADRTIMPQAMKEQKIFMPLLETVGLTKGGKDLYSGRLLFPILDGRGRVIGFSGRKFQEETYGPKYYNTPETPLFKKSKVLYGLSHSRKRIAKERKVLIVEGQIDTLRMIAAGFNLTVAGQGTAFGKEQAKELINLGVQEIYLLFDGDQAGKEAAVKVGDLFQREGIEVFVAQFPEGKDPDLILQEEGTKQLKSYIEKSIGYLPFVVELLKGNQPLTPARKNQLVKEIGARIRGWDHPLMVHESLRKLAQLLSLPEEVLRSEMPESPTLYIKQQGSALENRELNPDRILEADLMRWLVFADDELLKIARENLTPDHFRTPAYKRLFTLFTEGTPPKDLLDLASQMESVEDQLLLSELLHKRINRERAKEGMIKTVEELLKRSWMQRRESLRYQMQRTGLTDERLFELAKEFDALKSHPPEVRCT